MPSTQVESGLLEGQNEPSGLDGTVNSSPIPPEITAQPPPSSGLVPPTTPDQPPAQTGTLAAALQQPPPPHPSPSLPSGHPAGLPGGPTTGPTGTQSPLSTAAHSLQHLNKLASEQQQTLAGTLGHTPPGGLHTHPESYSGRLQHPPSPVVIQPTTDVTNVSPNSVLTMNAMTTTPTPSSGGVNATGNQGQVTSGPITATSGQVTSGQVTAQAQNGCQADVQNNNTVKVKSCAGCGARICDRFLLHAMDRYWHTGCLKCSCCQAQLGEIGTTCYAKAGMILCKNDYIRLFGSSGTCSACAQSIPASEFVMRAQTNVYHLNCFTCVACNSRLVPGDRYSLFNGSLICEHDYPKVLKGHTQIPLRPSHKVC